MMTKNGKLFYHWRWSAYNAVETSAKLTDKVLQNFVQMHWTRLKNIFLTVRIEPGGCTQKKEGHQSQINAIPKSTTATDKHDE